MTGGISVLPFSLILTEPNVTINSNKTGLDALKMPIEI